ncbi:hypothetical protein [Bacillus sp. HMF5848]|uniref:hypothetical protein n=1 Tax=Bacillus sp. HMF5848 TaxID=2495421 RepID=UPI00163AA705|nr:hypothetical protein [Bacillus sp. HMF5848]
MHLRGIEWTIFDKENMDYYVEHTDEFYSNHEMGGDLEKICSIYLREYYHVEVWNDDEDYDIEDEYDDDDYDIEDEYDDDEDYDIEDEYDDDEDYDSRMNMMMMKTTISRMNMTMMMKTTISRMNMMMVTLIGPKTIMRKKRLPTLILLTN